MIIPKSIMIGGQLYVIKKKFTKRDLKQLGCSILYKNVIEIETNISQTQQETVLLHEIIEVINDQHQLDMPHHVIQSLEASLYQVLKFNKLLK